MAQERPPNPARGMTAATGSHGKDREQKRRIHGEILGQEGEGQSITPKQQPRRVPAPLPSRGARGKGDPDAPSPEPAGPTMATPFFGPVLSSQNRAWHRSETRAQRSLTGAWAGRAEQLCAPGPAGRASPQGSQELSTWPVRVRRGRQAVWRRPSHSRGAGLLSLSPRSSAFQ